MHFHITYSALLIGPSGTSRVLDSSDEDEDDGPPPPSRKRRAFCNARQETLSDACSDEPVEEEELDCLMLNDDD